MESSFFGEQLTINN